jgi:protein-disulfide isomerase
LKVTFSGQSDNGVVFVSKDGKTFVRGEMFSTSKDPFAENRAKLKPDSDPSKGPADARATMYVFSDFQCPHCRQFYLAMKSIEPKYSSLRIIYKDFPIVSVHPWALTAAVGARCAYMQKPAAFWTLHDMIFEDQDVISSENVWEKIVDFAGRAGLDKEAFRACLSAIDPQKQIETDVMEGQTLNINSTPTVFINGRPIPGGDAGSVQQYLDYELGIQAAGSATRPAPAQPAQKP